MNKGLIVLWNNSVAMSLPLSAQEEYLVNQKVAILSHKVQHSAQEIEQEIDEKVWKLEVEKVNPNEFMATLIVQEPMISISTGDLVTYKGVPTKFTVRSPSLEYLLDAVEKILMEQIEEIKHVGA
ncbi:MAG TPA: hypothetical protein VEG65_01465 [Candidatus Bathyarchaeia archaeon]|nr:hypothetical protein [Candidatus Bathyarchaeia archaeon]